MQIKCDKCSAVSETVMPETYLEGDIEFTFFRCPTCGELYPVSASDMALRAYIAEYNRMRDVIRRKPVTEQFIPIPYSLVGITSTPSSGEVFQDTIWGTSTSLRESEVSETGGETVAILQYFSEIIMTA